MKEFNSSFNDGTGKLNIQYEGTAGTTEAPVTSDCNCGEDRTVQVTVVTDDGGASKTVTVNQEGVREQFIPADQTEGMRGSDGELFLGIKEKYANNLPDCCDTAPLLTSIIHINQLESDPSKMITGDIRGEAIQWIRNNSHRVLAKKTAEGQVTYAVLDDSNSNFYEDGTPSVLTGEEGDVFVKLPKFYYRGNDDGPNGSSGDNVTITFSTQPFEDCVEWDGNILIGVYKMPTGSKAQSISDKILDGYSGRSTWIDRSKARGLGYQIIDWQIHCVMACLFYAYYGNTDSSGICGKGDNNYKSNTGKSNNIGMKDTLKSDKLTYVNFWGLEDWYDKMCEWMDGITSDDAGHVIISTPDPTHGRSFAFTVKESDNYLPTHYRFGKYLDISEDNEKYIQEGDYNTFYCDKHNGPREPNHFARRAQERNYDSGGVSSILFNNGKVINGFLNMFCSRLAFRGIMHKAESVEAFKALPVL